MPQDKKNRCRYDIKGNVSSLQLPRGFAVGGLITCLAMAILLGSIRSGYFDSFTTLAIRDTSVLRRVFFSGEPWLVHCDYASSLNKEVHPVIREARKKIRSLGINLGRVGCSDILPGRARQTVLKRFNFPGTPVGFIVANGDPPVVLSPAGLTSAAALTRFAENIVDPKVYPVLNAVDFAKTCTDRSRCLLLVQKRGLVSSLRNDVIPPFMKKHNLRQLKVMTIDPAKFFIKLDDQLMAMRERMKEANATGSISVICLHRREKKKEAASGNATTYEHFGAFLEKPIEVELYADLLPFMRKCGTAELGAYPLVLLSGSLPVRSRPRVSTRGSASDKNRAKLKSRKSSDGINWAELGVESDAQEEEDSDQDTLRYSAGPEELEAVGEDEALETSPEDDGDEIFV